MTDEALVLRMVRLFQGFVGAHGTHGEMKKNATKSGKMEIKQTARTVRNEPPEWIELWRNHLKEEDPIALGVIPIREDGTCYWGCIDIDQYDLDLTDIVKWLKSNRIPMVVCRTKSGGAHVFQFLQEPIPADQLRAYLQDVAARMGYGTSEIFPKQTRVLIDKGDLGNWLNMPYFGGTDSDRHGVKDTIGAMSLMEFLNYSEALRIHPDQLAILEANKEDSLKDGPPCLEHLTTVGFPEGTRNNGLFALAVFAKKKYPTKWRDRIEEYNHKFMDPPLTAEEVMGLIKNVEKKDYEYKCNDQPCMSYCNSALCRTRKFGVGGGNIQFPLIDGMSKLDAGESTLWFLNLEEHRIELTTSQLQNYKEFQRVCAEELTIFYSTMPRPAWEKMIGEAMSSATLIQASPEITSQGRFLEILENFCMNRYRGTKPEDLFLGKPFQDERDERHYFRLQDLMSFLEKNGFKNWGRNKVSQWIEKNKGGKKFFNVKGKGVNAYWVPDNFVEIAPLEIPESKAEII